VIEQDVLELGGVLEKRVDSAGGELGKSLIGGSEDGERTGTLDRRCLFLELVRRCQRTQLG
jgi:hypothetical protein